MKNARMFKNETQFRKAIEEQKQDNIAAIVDAVAYVDKDAIINRLQIIQQNANLEHAIEIADNPELSALSEVCCSKTGQPLQPIDLNEMAELIEINGIERTIYMLKKRAITTISNRWLFTDERALDKLTEVDPYGYFVFSAAKIVRAFQPGFNRQENSFVKDETDAHFRFVMTKRELWENLQSVPMELIVRGNEIMRRYLSFINSTFAEHIVKFSETNLACVTPEQFVQEVEKAISAVIWHEYEKGRLNSTPTYSDIVELRLVYQGHSNFRRQRNLKAMSETDVILHQLKDFMRDIKPGDYEESKRPWQLRELKAGSQTGVPVREHKGALVLKRATVNETQKKPIAKTSFATLLRASRDKRKQEGEK